MALSAISKLRMWLVIKGGSSPVCKMSQFYSKEPIAGLEIQTIGLSNLVRDYPELFTFKKTCRSFSLSLSNGMASIPPDAHSENVLFKNWLKTKQNSSVRVSDLNEFFMLYPNIRSVYKGNLNKLIEMDEELVLLQNKNKSGERVVALLKSTSSSQ